MSDFLKVLKDAKLEIPYKPNHPVWPVKQDGIIRLLKDYGPEEYNRMMGSRNDRIRWEETDPFWYGYEPATWALADVILGFISIEEFLELEHVPARWKRCQELIDGIKEFRAREARRMLLMGGNRASKTEYLCKRLVQQMKRVDNNIAWLFHSNERMSVTVHQKVIWKYMPNSWRNIGKEKHGPGYIAYNQQNGFSGNKVTGPNGSYIEFLFYEQDPSRTIEGGETGAPDHRPSIGVATDELVPMNFVETLEYRCATRRASMLHGFTPIEGYTDVVARYEDGSTPVYLEMGTALKEPVPVALVKRCSHPLRAVVYFHSHYNAYSNWKELKEITASEPDQTRLVRLYGQATKARNARFAKFSEGIHVVSPETIFETVEPEIRKGFRFEGTNWMVLDPAGSKNWFMLWARCTEDAMYIYREWPCQKFYIPGEGYPGPWAVPGSGVGHRFDGLPGPGCKPLGLGLPDYKELMGLAEGWVDASKNKDPVDWDEYEGSEEEVYIRTIDSRFAAAPNQTHSGNTTLLQELSMIGLFFEPAYAQEGMGFIDEGADIISTALSYKPGDRPGTWLPGHGPKLFISADCENLIFAMKTWTNSDGRKSATKDPIDCVRYLYNIGAAHVKMTSKKWSARGKQKLPFTGPKQLFAGRR